MKISFVIPCYNAAKNIRGVVAEIDEAMSKRPDFAYEVIMVNDASPGDDTAKVIADIARNHPSAIALDLSNNVGQPSALLAGMAEASGDVVMTSDDDGQTPVGQVFDFLEKLEEGYDIVCARYTDRDQPSAFRRLGSAVNRAMSDWLIEKPEGVYMAAFFMARRFVAEEMVKYPHSFPYISALVLRVTKNIGNVDVVQRTRASGESGYNFRKLLNLWLNGMTSMSVKPLRLAAKFGFLVSFIGFFFAFFTIVRKLFNPQISVGYTSIVSLFLIMSGVILLFLGLIGEYVGRIYMSVNLTPQYVIRSKTVSESKQVEPPSETKEDSTSEIEVELVNEI